MNVFDLRERLVGDDADYTRSFIAVRDGRIRELVESELESGLLWPDPIIDAHVSSVGERPSHQPPLDGDSAPSYAVEAAP
jgi:hypothetical protein